MSPKFPSFSHLFNMRSRWRAPHSSEQNYYTPLHYYLQEDSPNPWYMGIFEKILKFWFLFPLLPQKILIQLMAQFSHPHSHFSIAPTLYSDRTYDEFLQHLVSFPTKRLKKLRKKLQFHREKFWLLATFEQERGSPTRSTDSYSFSHRAFSEPTSKGLCAH